ncbi:MAG: cysteine desulfurase family protein [Candidatus Paceibacterota bacterium]
MKKRNIYLDCAATTPVDARVLKEMQPYFSKVFGNAGSLHSFGQAASRAVFDARKKIADVLGASYKEIVFTGSATEANNLALRGVVERAKREGVKDINIVVSAVEHESVFEAASALDVEVRVAEVSSAGVVDLAKLEKLIDKNTVLVSIMYANNEIGSFQDIKKLSTVIKKKRGSGVYPLLHTDAVQAFQYLSCQVDELGVDLMTLSSHKVYGPKGIGLLYVRSSLQKGRGNSGDVAHIEPIIFGGGQERGLRSGTENVAFIVGFAKALELADAMRIKETKRVCVLRDRFLKELLKIFPQSKLNAQKRWRLPNNINIQFKDLLAEEALVFLDLHSVAVSAGSACSAHNLQVSPTLKAIGLSDEQAKRSIRISLGRGNNAEELKRALAIFRKMRKSF